MQDGSFADILRAKVGATAPPAGGRQRPLRTATAPLFTPGSEAPYRRPPAAVWEVVQAAPRRRPATVLTQDARRALDALNALGADLDDCVSAAELRRAFRRLAREYHPDRHPGRSPSEIQRLAHCFADLAHHYHRLSATLLPSTSH